MINKQDGCECLRCSEPEIWDHIIRYRKTRDFRRKFITKLLVELMKKKPTNIEYEELFDMVEDILIYLEDGDKNKYVTNQHMIGIRFLFRRYIVKAWKGVNFLVSTYRNLNRIVVRHCVIYYELC